MKNKKAKRMETLKANGLDTSKYVNLSLNIPSGSKVVIMVNGKPYNISNDEIVKNEQQRNQIEILKQKLNEANHSNNQSQNYSDMILSNNNLTKDNNDIYHIYSMQLYIQNH